MPEANNLCQPLSPCHQPLSCASCCGIYNYRGHNRELVTQVLARQTEILNSWDGTEADMERVRTEIESGRPAPRFEVIYNCPFTGFLNPERTRVGCLLHPRFRGQDLRDYGRYGHRTCAEVCCSAWTYLSPTEARAVMAGARDWYLYGLCITDIDLIRDFFELCEMKLLAPLQLERIASEPRLAAAFGDYLALKEHWPWARDPGRFGKYFFVEKNYHIYQIDYERFGLSCPPHHGILLSLGSVFETRAELEAALALLDAKVEAFLQCYQEGEGSRRTG